MMATRSGVQTQVAWARIADPNLRITIQHNLFYNNFYNLRITLPPQSLDQRIAHCNHHITLPQSFFTMPCIMELQMNTYLQHYTSLCSLTGESVKLVNPASNCIEVQKITNILHELIVSKN